jgi:signal transduction histidine kinase
METMSACFKNPRMPLLLVPMLACRDLILPLIFFVLCVTAPSRGADGSDLLVITNLAALSGAVASGNHMICGLQMEVVVCASSRAEVGALIVQDGSGVEVLQLDDMASRPNPGDVIRLEAARCLLRRRVYGVEISGAPLIDNDGLHNITEAQSGMTLEAGMHPIRIGWFNAILDSHLELLCEGPGMPLQDIPPDALWQTGEPGTNDYKPGLRAECYEGSWEHVPDFNWLKKADAGTVTNIGTGFCTRQEYVGLRFNGFFKAPRSGNYRFLLRSDDGALFFIGDDHPAIRVVGHEYPPTPIEASAIPDSTGAEKRAWVSVQGWVRFVSTDGQGADLELRTGNAPVQVRLVDASGLDVQALMNSRVRLKGAGQKLLPLKNAPVLGRVLVAGAADLEMLDPAAGGDASPAVLNTAEQVQGLRREDAERHLPVRIRGVITSSLQRYYRGVSIQDDTRGIYVDLHGITNTISPSSGELWEIEGSTLPGDFAPIVHAENVKWFGNGFLPEPAHPAWNQIINGSMDAQYVEIMGVATAVSSNRVTLLLPEGALRAQIEMQSDTPLTSFVNCHLRIRGVLFAQWNAASHEVLPGEISLRNARINVDRPAPADIFDAPLKTAHELLRFDLQAIAFTSFKVRGQVAYADAEQVFLMDGGAGVRVWPVEKAALRPGDMVEAVGYPEISRFSPVLREAFIRKTGNAPLAPAQVLEKPEMMNQEIDSTRVVLAGKLLGWHFEGTVLVLEMQSGPSLFVARMAYPARISDTLRAGSLLDLTGVYLAQVPARQPGHAGSGFELLLNSADDVKVVSQPSWWTLPRLLGLVGLLLLSLALSSIWITQLRRQVEQRTLLLQREIRERERTESQRAIEAERSRIARDLHDDLGSSLTEIGVMASSGIRAAAPEAKSPALFKSIGEKARSLVDALDVIVWAVDPEENSLQSLADYLSGYAGDYLASSAISCRFKIPVALPEVILEGRVRHELFLAIKEALNNIVRHSRATEVEFHLFVSDSALVIIISDNGIGFAIREGEGHGLKNLPQRLLRLGGRCEVASGEGRGTQVRIELSLPVKGLPPEGA